MGEKLKQETSGKISDDIEAIESLESVDKILEILKKVTGLRIALIARVTESSWTACSVVDDAGFGLKRGDQLELATTY